MENISDFMPNLILQVLDNITEFKGKPEKAKEYYKQMLIRKINTKEEYAEELTPNWDKLLKREIEEKNEEYKNNFLRVNNFPIKNFNDFETDIYDTECGKAENIKKICIGFANNIDELKKGLYLYSNTRGSGKTLMAYILLNNLLNLNKRVYFTTSTELFFNLNKAISENSGENFKIIEKCKKIEILFLDDFGTEKVSEYVNNVLFNIIDHRLNNNKITIFTSNKSIYDISIDEKIKSRINKMCMTLEFPEQSIRNLEAEIENKELFDFLLTSQIVHDGGLDG